MDFPLKKIEQVCFGLMSPEDIRAMSAVTVETPDTYEDDGFPIEKGLMDPKMGVVDPSLVCRTCGFTGGECPGHFGSIELAMPVIHIGFGDVIHKILRSICNECGRILLNQDAIEKYRDKIEEGNGNLHDILKSLLTKVKNTEMKDDKQEEIVGKIIKNFFPEGVDDLDCDEIQEGIIEISRVLFTEAYLRDDEADSRNYIDSKYLCPHCKKNSTLSDIEKAFNNAELRIVKKESRFNFNKLITAKNTELTKELDKVLKAVKKLSKSMDSEDSNDNESFNAFKDNIEDEYKQKIKQSIEFDVSLGYYESALKEFNDKAIKKLGIKKSEDNENLFEKYENAVKKANDLAKDIVEDFKESKLRQVRNDTKNYIKAYLQKLVQEPIGLDKPVTIRQGDYRLNAFEVRERLKRISDEDSYVLGVNPEVARPEWLVLTVLPVPPVTVRPSITLDTGERSEDDLTHKLVDVIRINQRLLENMEAGAPQLIIEDLWELLQYHVITYFDNEGSGVPPVRHRSGRPLITLMQRLKGYKKDEVHDKSRGRFREHILGKRVNFSARTVMSPDPNIGINDVGVPEMIAKEVTVPAYVTEWNMDEMKKYVKNGPDIHPGAKYVIRKDGHKIRLRNKEAIGLVLEKLEPGFIIERHLIDGDIVLFNRHPSLHKLSMLAHEVKILPYKTFRINPAVCPPYNVDFDGDEMNIHVLQTIESRAEAKSLLYVQDNMKSPRFGGPLVGAIRDHISGAYLLTKSGTIFTEEEALQIIKKSGLEMPIYNNGNWILKQGSQFYKQKGELWTGKELFSLTLPNDLNMSFPAKISKSPIIDSLEEAHVIIENGILLQGVIDETAIGSTKGQILDRIFMDYGSERAREFLEKAINLSLCAIMKIGISNSMNDYEIPKEAQNKINDYLNDKLSEVDKLGEAYKEGHLQPLPGITLKDTLDLKISAVLNEARDVAGSMAENYFRLPENLPFSSFARHSYVMAHTGAKSSMLNITQISACVGQQSIRGQSLGNIFNGRGYQNRILPHFKKGEFNAKSGGFVKSSFLKGLDPIEFFFHAMGGRDTLADKYIRVANSGYMQRRLVNALQDLHTDKKGMVKDAHGNVVQFLYGEDGVDPAKSEFGKPADLNALIDELKMKNSNNDDFNNSYGASYENLSEKELKQLKIRSDYLSNKIKFTIKNYLKFVDEIDSKLEYIDIEFWDDDLKQLIEQLESTLQDLIGYKNKCGNFEYLDKISEKINYADKDLKDKKEVFNQKLSDLRRLEYDILDKRLGEHKGLILKAEYVLDAKFVIFSEVDSRLNNLIDSSSEISNFVNKKELLDNLENIKGDIKKQYRNLEIIKNKLNNKKTGYFGSIKQSNKEIRILNALIDKLNQVSDDYFEERLAEQENLYQNLLTLSEEIQSANIEGALEKFEKCFNRPRFHRQLKRYGLQDNELNFVKDDIKKDIIDGTIAADANFKTIILTRCGEFKRTNSGSDEDEFDKLLDNITFPGVDEDIVEECKNKVRNDYLEGNITLNHVELKLRNYINKKTKELKQLEELDKIRNNPNVPIIKVNLTQEENDEIYMRTEREILNEQGIDDVEDYVYYLASKKIRENQSEARGRLNIIRRDFSNLIQLNKEEQVEFIGQIERYINDNQIKYYDITEENIIELSKDFKNGKITLR